MTARILEDDWEFNVLGVGNYRRPGPQEHYFQFLREKSSSLPGDILEAGVYKGASLLATAMLLKEIGSNKIVYGFDTWTGFPPVYSENDKLSRFDDLHASGAISDVHLENVQRNREYREFLLGDSKELTGANISSSGDFSQASRGELERKLSYLGLDNVRLIEGAFNDTMNDSNLAEVSLMAALIDADLYQSYQVALPFIWDRLVPGGYIALDEYYSLKFPGARIACDEFFPTVDARLIQHPKRERDFERWGVVKEG